MLKQMDGFLFAPRPTRNTLSTILFWGANSPSKQRTLPQAPNPSGRSQGAHIPWESLGATESPATVSEPAARGAKELCTKKTLAGNRKDAKLSILKNRCERTEKL